MRAVGRSVGWSASIGVRALGHSKTIDFDVHLYLWYIHIPYVVCVLINLYSRTIVFIFHFKLISIGL